MQLVFYPRICSNPFHEAISQINLVRFFHLSKLMKMELMTQKTTWLSLALPQLQILIIKSFEFASTLTGTEKTIPTFHPLLII